MKPSKTSQQRENEPLVELASDEAVVPALMQGAPPSNGERAKRHAEPLVELASDEAVVPALMQAVNGAKRRSADPSE